MKIIRLVSKATVEEVILTRAEEKLRLTQTVIASRTQQGCPKKYILGIIFSFLQIMSNVSVHYEQIMNLCNSGYESFLMALMNIIKYAPLELLLPGRRSKFDVM